MATIEKAQAKPEQHIESPSPVALTAQGSGFATG